jgi:hypothetical protein
MKTIGLVGGMSWESTLEYYRIINETVKEKLRGFHSGQIVLYSVDFAAIEDLQQRGEWDRMAEILVEGSGASACLAPASPWSRIFTKESSPRITASTSSSQTRRSGWPSIPSFITNSAWAR